MMESQETNKQFKKTSFMIDHLLRTAHDKTTCTTDPVTVENYTTSTAGLNTTELCDSTETSHNGHKNTRAMTPTDEHLPDKNPEAASLSVQQERLLAKAITIKPYPTKKERRLLAAEIHITEDQLKMWYQKQRLTQTNQLVDARQRSAKLAYLNSLAESLLKQPQQPSPRQTYCEVPCKPVPLVGIVYPSPYTRPRVVPSLYVRHSGYRVRSSPYIVPRYIHPVNVLPYY